MFDNYGNWFFAHPFKDWCLVSYKSAYDNLDSLMEMGPANVCRRDPPPALGPVYRWYSVGLGKSGAKLLETPLYHKKNWARYLPEIRKILYFLR